MIFRHYGLALAAVLLAACAVLPAEIPESADCRARYLALDEKIDAAGVRDSGAHVIPGFPYLRSNRFLASFRNETADPARFDAWVDRLRRLDLETRDVELRNLGDTEAAALLSELERCGRAWGARDLADAPRRAQLRTRAAVPDNYSSWQRFLGLYPIAAPFMQRGVRDEQSKTRDDYARPLAALESPGPLVLWPPAAARAVTPAETARWLAADTDPLGIPRLSDAQWQRLAAAHAPSWWVETGGEFDRPGTPALRDGALVFDVGRPVTHFLPSYTRFDGRVLAQLVYTVWFSGRPPKGTIDSAAGALDGVIWRVTLDTDGQVLLYDSIHACGCYHYWFPAKPLVRRPQHGLWEEPVLLPQDPLPAGRLAIRIQSRTHFIRRIVAPAMATAAETKTYALADYRELLNLPQASGDSRSLFAGDGMVRGTERFERFWLWPSGVSSPGATRQWGRHATSFVGRNHFDDPGQLDRLFERAPEAD